MMFRDDEAPERPLNCWVRCGLERSPVVHCHIIMYCVFIIMSSITWSCSRNCKCSVSVLQCNLWNVCHSKREQKTKFWCCCIGQESGSGSNCMDLTWEVQHDCMHIELRDIDNSEFLNVSEDKKTIHLLPSVTFN